MRTPDYCKPYLYAVYKTAAVLFFTCSFYFVAAQKKHPRDSLMTYYPQIKFIVHAPELLPKLAAQQQWAAMQNYLDNWNNSFSPNAEIIYSLQTLLDVQNNESHLSRPACNVLLYLADYSKELKKTLDNDLQFKYFIQLSFHYRYDASADVKQTLLFIRSWSKQLLQTKQLNKAQLFLCRVFAGEITDPVSYYQSNPKVYPAIAATQDAISAANEKYFVERRNGPALVATFTAGIWVPGNHLMVLGIHPSIGFQVGMRNKLNEYDLSFNYRFVQPPNKYQVMRHDSTIISDYYEGGYVGFEYTRYLLHYKYFDAGLTSGAGYDYFSIVNSSGNDHNDDVYSPAAIGSFNFSNGIRLKYFLHKKNFLGLVAKYNLIHYNNAGGTNLNGNAFTIDLIYGGH